MNKDNNSQNENNSQNRQNPNNSQNYHQNLGTGNNRQNGQNFNNNQNYHQNLDTGNNYQNGKNPNNSFVEKDATRAKSIKIMSIFSLSMTVLSIIFAIIATFLLISYVEKNSYNTEVNNLEIIFSLILYILSFLMFLSSGILNLISGILILATTWRSQKATESKILWGVLTLILLGAIASLIFSVKNVK